MRFAIGLFIGLLIGVFLAEAMRRATIIPPSPKATESHAVEILKQKLQEQVAVTQLQSHILQSAPIYNGNPQKTPVFTECPRIRFNPNIRAVECGGAGPEIAWRVVAVIR